MPTKIGERLISDVFERRLLGLRDAQNRKIEELKEQLLHLGDRGKRSNELEFSAIRSVWELFVAAWLSTNTAVIASMDVPDFSSLSDDDVDAILTGNEFSEREKSGLKAAAVAHRHDIFVRVMTWKFIVKAWRDVDAVRLLLRKQRIFMPKEMREVFEGGIDLMSRAVVGKKLEFQDPRNFDSKPGIAYLEKHVKIFDDVANHANARLFRGESKELEKPAGASQQTVPG